VKKIMTMMMSLLENLCTPSDEQENCMRIIITTIKSHTAIFKI